MQVTSVPLRPARRPRRELRLIMPAAFAVGVLGCGGPTTASRSSQATAEAAAPGGAGGDGEAAAEDGMMGGMSIEDQAMIFGPLEVGADWKTFTKVNRLPVRSKTHGGRFVDTWVNGVGLSAYQTEDAEIPEGTIIVKSSWEPKDGAPSEIAGPLFVMEKRAKGADEEHNDWYYAIHWAEPPARWRERLGGPIYWRSPSKKVEYCWDCHESYDRELGGVPADSRSW